MPLQVNNNTSRDNLLLHVPIIYSLLTYNLRIRAKVWPLRHVQSYKLSVMNVSWRGNKVLQGKTSLSFWLVAGHARVLSIPRAVGFSEHC